MSIFLHTNPFKGGRYYGNSVGVRPPSPSDFTPELLHLAGRCLDRVFRPGFTYQKCGVMLTALAPATTAKGDLFDDRNRTKERRLMAAVDAVNARFGAGALVFAQATPPPGRPELDVACGHVQPALHHLVVRSAGGPMSGPRL